MRKTNGNCTAENVHSIHRLRGTFNDFVHDGVKNCVVYVCASQGIKIDTMQSNENGNGVLDVTVCARVLCTSLIHFLHITALCNVAVYFVTHFQLFYFIKNTKYANLRR